VLTSPNCWPSRPRATQFRILLSWFISSSSRH